MANTYEKLRDLLEGEIETITKAGTLDKDKLHCVYEMVDIIKDIGKIDEYDSGYSQANRMYDPYMAAAYANAGRNRDSRGRYSRNYSRGGSYNGGGSYARGGGYSRAGDNMESLERMMEEAQTEQEREAIRRVMEMM